MLASGGYAWTIVPLEKRIDYMAALEEASTNQNIEPFTKFLGSLVQSALDGKAEPSIPSDYRIIQIHHVQRRGALLKILIL